jgi:mannose/cellobiose epimerase-like protein (N-acyl-D-glucosamine 2-epimerase family)
MAAARKLAKASGAKPAAHGDTLRRDQRRTTTTVRLSDALYQEIEAIKQLDDTSVNQVIEAGMRYYVQARRDRLEQQLDRALQALRARDRSDAEFDTAIARLVQAEAAASGQDPAEGRMIDRRRQPAANPAVGDLAAKIRSLMAAG